MSKLENAVSEMLRCSNEEPGLSVARVIRKAQLASGYSEKTQIAPTSALKALAHIGAISIRGNRVYKGSGQSQQTASGGDDNLERQLREAQSALHLSDQDRRALKSALENRNKELEVARKALSDKKDNERIVEIRMIAPNGKPKKKMAGIFHKKIEDILNLAKSRMNIFIYGPTGCGKSHICQQVAEALGLDYCFVSCTTGMSEGVLGGRLLPVGVGGKFDYVISEFIRCYESGGVFLLDEIDAADPNVLLLVNAALANGKVAVTNRPKKPYAEKHPEFVCIAAANTCGTNADRMYSGRSKLDAATLDRFQIGKIMMDYDHELERQLAEQTWNDRLPKGDTRKFDDSFLEVCWKVRDAIDGHRMERACSTRFIRDSYAMMATCKWSEDRCLEALFEGWREDEVNKVKSEIR